MQDKCLLMLLDGLQDIYQKRYDEARDGVRVPPYLEGYYEGKIDLVHEIKQNILKDAFQRNGEEDT